MNNDQEKLLARIASNLMLHGSFINNLGLFNGKIGFVLFFFHYAQYSGKKIYDHFAGEVIDEIYNEIHDHYPNNFRDGLCGIAWGMEYIIQHRFVDANANDVLENLDRRILEWDVRKIRDISLETGLLGIAHYVISRCSGKNAKDFPLQKNYIIDLIQSIYKTNLPENERIINHLNRILNDSSKELPDYSLLLKLIASNRYQTKMLFNKDQSLGIVNNGLTGIGLHLLFTKKN